MKIQHLRIENILGIKHLELEPGGTITEISGDNGLGKTSILEAIKSAVKTGHDATLLRQGAAQGEVVLVLDDQTTLHKRVFPERSTLDLLKDGKKVKGASDTIKGLTDLLSVNPVDFLTAPKKDRIKVLLEAMPIVVDPAKLAEVSGVPISVQPQVDGLALIDLVRTRVYDDRTGTNRAVKEKEATINQLSLAMPDAPGGVDGNEDELRASLEAARVTRDAETKRIDEKLSGVREASAKQQQTLKDNARAAIEAINADLAQLLEKERSDLADIEAKAGRVRQRALDTFTATATPLNEAINAHAANRTTAAKRQVTIENLAKMGEELSELMQDAEKQTKALDGIDAYRVQLLNDLPIPGLEVRDGEVWRDGIQFDRLNTAQQVEIAIDIAALRAGDLAIVCVDRFECLSPATFEAFKARAEGRNLQLFVTRVTDGEMTIATE